MKVNLEITNKDLLIYFLIFCVLTLCVFLYRQDVAQRQDIEMNANNIRAVAIAAGVLKSQPAPKPQGGDDVGK